MANSANFEASLKIKAGVEGTDAIDKLAQSISEAGVDVTHLTDESAKLAKQFGEIENKQALITQFRELKAATNEANKEWQQAQTLTASYTNQIAEAKDSLEALETALKSQGSMSQEEAKATQAEYKAMVNEIKNLEKAQADQATRASQLKTQYEDLNAGLVNTRSAMHEVGLATTGLNAQQKALEEESRAAQASLAELTTEAKNLNEIAQAKITLGIDTDEKARQQIEEVTKAYETLRASGTLSSQEMARATQLHTQRVAELEGQLEQAKPSLESMAEEFGKVTAAAGGLSYVAKQAMDFEEAMAGVKKMVDGTPEQIASLASQIQGLSIDLGMTSSAVAEIAAQGGGLGVPIEKLGEFTTMAGKMAVAFDMTAEKAGDAAAKLANVFGIPIDQVGSLGDAINVLGNTTAAKESEIVDAMLRIGGNAKQFGLAGEQAGALAASMISLGKTPEVAATAINALLTKLQTANVQGDDFKNTMKGIGISADQMAQNIATNPQQALSGFLNTLAKMDDQQRSVAAFKLFGQDYVDDVNALVGGLDGYNKALSSVSDKTSTAGAMQKEFDAKMSVATQSLQKAQQAAQVLAEKVGAYLLPIISKTGDAIGTVAGQVNTFAETFPMITQFAVLLASAKVGLVAYQSVLRLSGMAGITAFGQVTTAATATTAATSEATVAATRLNAVIGALGNTAQSTVGRLQAFKAAGVSGSLQALAGQMMSLNGLFAAAAGWTIGQGIGKSLYESSQAARTFGDAMGSVAARIESLVTTGGLEKYNQNFKTSKQSAIEAAEAERKHAESIDGKAESIIKADAAAQKQVQSNQELEASLKKAKDNVTALNTQMTVMAANGQTNTTEYKALSSQLTEASNKVDVLTQAHNKAIGATINQAEAARHLVNTVKLTEANLEGMRNRLAEMEAGGQKNTQAYKDLSQEIGNTKDKLVVLKKQAEDKGFSEGLKTDLDKASESFKALGLDAQEFATGISGKANAALTAFVDVAHLAEGDTRKLALAYNAAKDAAGDNQAAQDALNEKLNQITEGNSELAQSIKITAEAQKNAKDATGDHTQALGKLGESMTAAKSLGVDINAVMNQVDDTFKQNSQAVLQVADGYNELKNKGLEAGDLLYASLNKVLEGAKNQKEIQIVQQMYEEYGKQGKLSSEQVSTALDQTHKKTLELEEQIKGVTSAYKTLGLESQAELAKKAADYKQAYDDIAKDVTATEAIKKQAYEKYAQAAVEANNNVMTSEVKTQGYARGYADVVVENGKVATKTAEEIEAANKKVADSHKQVGDSAAEAAEKSKQSADEQATANAKASGSIEAWMEQVENATKRSYTALSDIGVGADQASAAFARLKENAFFSGEQWGGFSEWAKDMADLQKVVDEQANSFRQAHDNAEKYSQVLSNANVGVNELADAEAALRRAQDANIEGIVRMDSQTLSNLQNAIDSARAKMEDLANQAKSTADNLEANLAKMKGDDATALRIEQTKKLADLQEKLNEAQKRGSSEEVAQLQRAIELQKQINDEETKQADAKRQDKIQKDQEKLQKDQEKTQKKQTQEQEKAQRDKEKAEKESLDKEKQIADAQAKRAKSSGDDVEALKLEQKKKLIELENQLAKAEASNNQAEIDRLHQLIDLQQDITNNKVENVENKKQDALKKEQEKAEKERAKATPDTMPSPKALPSTSTSEPNIAASAKDVAYEISKIKKEAIDEFMRVLKDELKRLPK